MSFAPIDSSSNSSNNTTTDSASNSRSWSPSLSQHELRAHLFIDVGNGASSSSSCDGAAMGVGTLTMYYGPMYSGKTEELLREYNRYVHAGRRVLLLKPMRDTRHADAEMVRSRNGRSESAVRTHTLMEQLDVALARHHRRPYDVVMIDELQFFNDHIDVLTFVRAVLAAGKHVVVSGLDGDYQRAPYMQVVQLIPLARCTRKLTAVCMHCRDADAPYTWYAGAQFEGFRVGDTDFSAACERCYARLEREQQQQQQRNAFQ